MAVAAAIVAGVAAVGGAVVGAIGQKKAAEAEQEMAETNEAFALKEARQLEKARQMAVGDIKQRADIAAGGIRLAAGASGVKITGGSPLAQVSQSYAHAEQDISRTNLQYQMNIAQRRHEASQYGQQAEAIDKTKWWNFAGNVLGGVSGGASAFM